MSKRELCKLLLGSVTSTRPPASTNRRSDADDVAADADDESDDEEEEDEDAASLGAGLDRADPATAANLVVYAAIMPETVACTVLIWEVRRITSSQ